MLVRGFPEGPELIMAFREDGKILIGYTSPLDLKAIRTGYDFTCFP